MSDVTTLERAATQGVADVETACAAAAAAFDAYRATDVEARAAFLEVIGEEIVALGDALADAACRESGLPRGRIAGERGRKYMTAPAGSLADERARNGHKAPWTVPYFGVGNELWGCGGNMRHGYAADLTRRYATFIKAPEGTRIMKIAAGANVDDYNWTETLVREAAGQIDGMSLHYYTVPGGWPPRASATQFDEAGWAQTLSETLRMDDLITRHSAIMDKYDPDRRIWLAVDECGTWYAGDPGTNPGFLRQQNTLRDALVAAINLNIFAKHADGVKLTAIAQMVNVLQAMVLTDGAKMVLTPTYHVFAMYKPYMDGTDPADRRHVAMVQQGRVDDARRQRERGARQGRGGARGTCRPRSQSRLHVFLSCLARCRPAHSAAACRLF